MNPRIVSEPTAEFVTLEEARVHLRLDTDGISSEGHPEDMLIEAMIGGAREWGERYLARSLATKTYELSLPGFPSAGGAIELRMPPVREVQSVTYIDASGDPQTLDAADYGLDARSEPGQLLPAQGASWPATAAVANAVTVRYVAGYDLPGESSEPVYPLPKAIRAGLLLLLHDLYENRGNSTEKAQQEVPMGVQSMLTFWRIELGV